MLLSIIIPIYNIENYIERCVKSILQQDFPSNLYELILVNDGSKDGSLQILEKLRSEYPNKNLIIFSKENGGLSSARNFGLEKANGDFIWFVDGDDWVSVDSLRRVTEELNKYPDLEILEFDLIIATEFRSGFKYVYGVDKKSVTENLESGRKFLEDHGYSLGVTVKIYNTAFLKGTDVIFPVGKYSEDNIFSLQTLLSAKKFRKIFAYLYFYYQRSDSISHNKTTEHLRKYYDDIFENYLKMKMVVIKEPPSIQNKVKEMIAYFQLVMIIGLYKQGKFSLATQYAKRMKAEGLIPLHSLSSDKSAKFIYLRKVVNLYFSLRFF